MDSLRGVAEKVPLYIHALEMASGGNPSYRGAGVAPGLYNGLVV